MAIEIIGFKSGNLLEDLGNWLNINAKEYFDRCEVTGSGYNITCYIGSIVALYISANGLQVTITLANGVKKLASISNVKPYVSKIVKTSNGLGFIFNIDGINYKTGLFITKTNNGDVGFCLHSTVMKGAGNITVASFKNSVNLSAYPHDSTRDYGTVPANLTVLTPLVCNDEDYLPHLYLQTFTQYQGVECIFTAGGKQYFSNGYIALEE